jgi:polyphenol oxidase
MTSPRSAPSKGSFFSHTWTPRPAVRAWFSARAPGFSQAPYDALNLGVHVGDAPESVARNRAALEHAMGVPAVYLQQVHGVSVLQLQNGMTPDSAQADGAWTQEKNLACAMLVADCLPILLCHKVQPMVGAVHAGWRGLCGAGDAERPGVGVLEAFFRALPKACAEPNDWLTWLGPCIGPQAFEVGPEVRQCFVQHHPQDAACFEPVRDHHFMADLAGLARARLGRLGLDNIEGNDSSSAWCTYTNPTRYFSHRRATHQGATTGRMAACIALC